VSLLAELQTRGITAEDLEKAASVRLFEKAAAAEGVNLDDLSETQVTSLFNQFVSRSVPSTKEASAMNNEVIDLFEKTASAEGIDLDDMSDAELAQLFNHYVENVLPEQLAEAEGQDKEAMVQDAHEKLAEAEILGRHMARAYADEIQKIAEKPPMGLGKKIGLGLGATGLTAAGVYGGKKLYDRRKARKAAMQADAEETSSEAEKQSSALDLAALVKIASVYGFDVGMKVAEEAAAAADAADAVADAAKAAPSSMGLGKKIGLGVGATGLLAAGAYGGKKLYDRRKARLQAMQAPAEEAPSEAEKQSSAFVDARAVQLLRMAGYNI
jgi:hypothetical protein